MKKTPMEDFFRLGPSDDQSEQEDTEITKSCTEVMEEAQEIYSSITTAEKIDNALPTVSGLEEHDAEMDKIANKAMHTFEDLILLGSNVPAMHSGKLFEVAGQMLKTALDAKNSKTERKLKMIDLQLKKIRIEQGDPSQGSANNQTGSEFDRNALLKYLVSSKTESPVIRDISTTDLDKTENSDK